MNQSYLITALAVVVVGGGAFVGGMKYQELRAASERQFFSGPGGNQMMIAGGGQKGQAGGGKGATMVKGNRPVVGEIISQDENSITVKLEDGSSRIVLLSDTTAINQASAATRADLKVGETINAFGTENNDGSITAQNIQLNPIRMNVTIDANAANPTQP